MAAAKQITREKIIKSACAIVRSRGMAALNARTLAAEMGCSTRPIYAESGGMGWVRAEVMKRINETYRGYIGREVASGKYPPFKAYGMGYIRFAREEKNYFQQLFMRDRRGEEPVSDGGDISDVLAALRSGTGLDGDRAKLFHAECWVFVHGVASMLATSYLDVEEEFISDMLTDVFSGLKTRFGV